MSELSEGVMLDREMMLGFGSGVVRVRKVMVSYGVCESFDKEGSLCGCNCYFYGILVTEINVYKYSYI